MRDITAGLLLVLIALAVFVSWILGSTTAHSQDPVEQAQRHLRDNASRYGLSPDLSDLTVVGVRESPGGQHVWFQQTVDGVPVEGAAINVSLPRPETGLQPFVSSGYVARVPVAAPIAGPISFDDAVAAAKAAVSPVGVVLRGNVEAEQVYLRARNRYHLSWRVLIPAVEPFGSWLVHVRADTGEVLSKRDLVQRDDGRVFDPNPLQGSVCEQIGSCPTVFHCESAENADILTGDYGQGTTQGWSFVRQFLRIQAGQNKLLGQYVNATAFGGGLADEPDRLYRYPCSDGAFEESMVYYHVDSAQRRIQDLGFTSILNESFPADARDPSETCNAYYDPAPANWGIHMGVSNGTCPDEGEDADGIVHEYGHAVQDAQVLVGLGFGGADRQSGAMGEGFADYLAAAMYASPCLFEWTSAGQSNCDGGTTPGLRTLINNVAWTLPNGPALNLPSWCPYQLGQPVGDPSPHCVGLLWGGALWDIATTIGSRDVALRIVLESHFHLNTNDPTFVQGKDAICNADLMLYGGQHIPAISNAFTGRGLGPCSGPVGGIAELPEVTGDSGWAAGTYAALAALAAAALLAVTAGAWYARRRLS